jgi:ATP-dependent helicase/nuclease subunit B
MRPPEDAEYEPFVWLDAKQRGTILHAVFEEIARRVIARTLDLHDAAAEAAMREVFHAALAREESMHPPPSRWVRDAEANELDAQLTAWLRAERAAGDGSDWHAVEQDLAGTTIMIGRHAVTVQGFIDRVDRTAAGFRIVDYKTTRHTDGYFGPAGGHFKGGRLVQPVFYRLAMTARTGMPVTEFAYRFPAGRPPQLVRRYHDDDLTRAERALLPTLAAHLESGAFLPTDDSADCGYCDVKDICRVGDDGWQAASPRAEWTRTRLKAGNVHPHLVPLQRRRSGEALP